MKSISIEKAVEIALEQHQAGNFERAESLYMEILRQDPGNVDAMHLLGVLAQQGKNPHAAVQLIRAALSRRGDVPIFHYNLAESLRTLRLNAEAIASYRRAIELAPEYFEAHNNLSIAFNDEGNHENAAKAARVAIELRPNDAPPWNNLGNALRGLRHWEQAEAAYRKALLLRPEFAECSSNLALLLYNLGRFAEALEQYEGAIRLAPTDAALHTNLGNTQSQLRRFQDAAHSFQQAIDLNPKSVEANNNLGAALRSMSQNQHAIPYFEKAIELDPDFVPGYANLASSLKDLGKKDEALAAIEKAIKLSPDHAPSLFLRAILLRDMGRNDEAVKVFRQILKTAPDDVPTLTALGYALQERGELDEAMKVLKRSIELKPDPQTHSNVLMTINYHPGYSPADLLVAHQSWAELHEKPHRAAWFSHPNSRDPNRRLRVGYVSPDFRGHVVAHFLEPVLDHHNHEQFEIYGYAHITATDSHTWRLRSQIDQWRETAQMPADKIAAMIREDQIDILIELAGHTGGNAMAVFARKPAPVQINMIGFPSTTGLSGMDYRITDELCDPTDVTDAFNSETLIRMPGLFWCYQPSDVTPDIGPLPADENNVITFTSVNNFTKVTPDVQHMWAKIMTAVPNSKLILQTAALASTETQQAVTAIFVQHGVAADRLDFRIWSDTYEYYVLLNKSDMTLDPYPFNGGTTTCHSLWMGAPVITLAGDRHASRMGLSMMTAIGLPEFVAHTPDEYVQIAVRFANDLPRLREIRKGMRDRLKASPLLDAVGYTRNLEAEYRKVWKAWCESGT